MKAATGEAAVRARGGKGRRKAKSADRPRPPKSKLGKGAKSGEREELVRALEEAGLGGTK